MIGRPIHLTGDRTTRRVVGVMRPDLVFPQNEARPAFYLSPSRGDRVYPDRRILARLADGVSLDDARATARAIALSRVAADRGEMFAWQQARYRKHAPPALPTGRVDVRLERYINEPVDKYATRVIWLILACGIGVAAVAGANVLNLMLVRGAARRQEVAIRLALGASRARIVAELIIESALLASAGVVAGLLIAFWQWQLLDASFEARHMFGDIDITTAAYAIIAGLLLTTTVGVWPGVRASSMKIEEVLRDVRRAGIGASPLEGILGRMVIGSTAVTVTLLVCAMMFAFSARDTARRSGAGFAGVYTSAIDMDSTVAPGQRGMVALTAVGRVRALPGIAAAAIGLTPPSGPTRRLAITPAGRPMLVVRSDIYSVSAGYFDILSIDISEGRAIDARDSRDSTGAVVIGQAIAHQLFPGGGAIGQTLTIRDLDDSTNAERTARIVGVAEDGVRGAGQLRIYFGFGSMTSARTSMVIKAAGKAVPQSNLIGATLRGVPGLSATNASVRSRMSRVGVQVRRYLSIGFGMFAIVGLLLATIGTYGVVAYSVVRRTHEIGVRMALGADRRRVVAMILEQGLRLTLVGLAVGLVLAIGAARVINGVVEDMTTNYPLAVAGIMLLVGVISLAASGIPGYRAGRLNPVDCLRAE